MSPSKKKILILMSGSIACYKVCALISSLVKNQFEVKVVMSAAAQKFIGPATIEGLSGNTPYLETFESGRAMEHIYLERWADIILLAPATANTINRMGQGLGDDLITTIFLAHDFKKPFLVAPAMNTQMYLHPVTQKSVALLREMRLNILEAASGVLACGEVGYGRLLEPDLIFKEIGAALASSNGEAPKLIRPHRTVKVLITSGGTQEPIDDVRVITNRSTGKTAAFIADQFAAAGFDVTYLSAQTAVQPLLDCTRETFVTFNELAAKLRAQLSNRFDVVIHAAAVSDYAPARQMTGKMSSDADEMQLTFKKNPKLIEEIKNLAPHVTLVGFKLTSGISQSAVEEKVKQLFEKTRCDFVVHNDWKDVRTSRHIFNLNSRTSSVPHLNLTDLSNELIQIALMKEVPS